MISRRRAQPLLAAAWRRTSRRSTTSSPTTSLRQIIQRSWKSPQTYTWKPPVQEQVPKPTPSTSALNLNAGEGKKSDLQGGGTMRTSASCGNWMKMITMVLGSGPTSADSAFHRQNLQEEVDILLICETWSKIMKMHCNYNIYDSKALNQLNKAGKAHGTNRLQRFAKNCRFWI